MLAEWWWWWWCVRVRVVCVCGDDVACTGRLFTVIMAVPCIASFYLFLAYLGHMLDLMMFSVVQWVWAKFFELQPKSNLRASQPQISTSLTLPPLVLKWRQKAQFELCCAPSTVQNTPRIQDLYFKKVNRRFVIHRMNERMID